MDRWVRTSSVVLGSLAMLLAAPASVAMADPQVAAPIARQYNVNFSTSNQSLWGAGGGVNAGIDKTFTLIDESWDQSASSRDVQGISGVPGVSFGGGANASSNGDIGLSAHFRDFSGGQVSVNYPVQVALTTPAPGSFNPGQTVRIGSSWSLRPGATLTTAPLPGHIDLIARFKLYANATGEVCLFSCTSFSFFPALDIGQLDQAILTSDDVHGTIPSPASSYISGTFGVPNVPLVTTVGADGKTLISSGTQDFVQLQAHLEKWATYLLGIPPLSVSASYAGASGGYDIFSSTINLALRQAETLTFTPTVQVSMSLPTSVTYTVRDAAGNALRSGGGATIAFDAGQSVDVTYPAGRTDILNVTPTFSLANLFSHQATTTFTQDITLAALSVTLVIPSVQVTPAITFPGGCLYYWHSTASWNPSTWGDGYWACINGTQWPSYTLPAVYSPAIDLGTVGPVWSKTVQSYSTTDTSLFDGDRPAWSLAFASLLGLSFPLQPNRPPVASAGGPATLPEGATAVFTSAGSVDPDGDPLTYAWTFGDGTVGSGASPTHVYADDATYTATLTVTDPLGLHASAATTVIVTNVAPTVAAGVGRTVSQGDLVTLASATFNDKGTADTHTATINWGDGTATTSAAVTETPFGPPGSAAGANGSVQLGGHVYADDGAYSVKVCLTDDDGAVGCDTLWVTVNNVAPTVVAAANQTVDEGSTLATTVATFNDKGTLDTHTASVDWGDRTPLDIGHVTESPFGPPGSTAGANGSVAASHIYDDNGRYTVTTCVTDDGGATTCVTSQTTVLNVPPTAHLRGGPITGYWGTPIDLTADVTDPSHADTAAGFANHWVWGDNTADFADHSLSPARATHTYDNVGGYTVSYDATDKDGGNTVRSRDTKAITVTRRPTTISCTAANSTFGYASAISALLVDRVNPANARLLGRTVGYATGDFTWTATTDASGLASSQTPTQDSGGTPPPLLPGTHVITVTFAGDVNYEPATATCDYTVSNSSGHVQGQTKQGVNGVLGQIHIQVAAANGVATGDVTYKDPTPWALRSRTIDGLGISTDGRTAWISGTAGDGRTFVIYAEDNGPRSASVVRLWIGDVIQDGDGTASNGQVHITRSR